MENLIFSINAVLPMFVVMLAGYILRQKHIINENFVETANMLTFRVTYPVLLFMDVAGSNITEMFDLSYALYAVGSTIFIFLFIWVIANRFFQDKRMVGSFVQGSFRGNFLILGLATIQNIYGSPCKTPILLACIVPLYNILAVIVLAVNARGSETLELKKLIKGILTNPLLLGVVAGLPFSLLHITLPEFATRSMNYFYVMSTPLALIAIGGGIDLTAAVAKLKPAMAATAIKLVVQPLVFLPLAYFFGFRGADLTALLIVYGGPAAVSSYTMAKAMGCDGVLASNILVLTALFSAFTLTAGIYFLKTFHLLYV